MPISINRWSRKLHRWGALITAIPMILVIVTGLLLQAKKQLTWVQPVTQKGEVSNATPEIEWSEILAIAKREQYSAAGIESWKDIDRLDVRVNKGMVKVRAKSNWELQIDLKSGEVLQFAYRRSDWIERLHDGSFFGRFSKLVVFLGNGLILLGLWVTGLYLWYLPWGAKRKKRKRKQQAEVIATETASNNRNV